MREGKPQWYSILMTSHIAHPRAAVTIAPERPGVYFFYSADRQNLYIGKAINLRNRLKQHFPAEEKPRKRPSRQHVAAASTVWVSWIVTESELHALVLEDKLIKNHSPIANKRQKKFLLQEYIGILESRRYISFGANEPVPKNVAEYYGPFSDRYFVNELLEIGKRFFGIDSGRSEAMFEIAGVDHGDLDFRSFLAAEDTKFMEHLNTKMRLYASARQFELAANVRDTLDFCEKFIKRQRFRHQFRTGCLAIQNINGSNQTWLFTKGRLSYHSPEILSRGAIKQFFFSGQPHDKLNEPDWALFDRAQVVQSWLTKNRAICTYWFEDTLKNPF